MIGAVAVAEDERREREDEDIRRALEAVVSRLSADALKRVGEKSIIEERWLEDLRQYHGRYDEHFERALFEANRKNPGQTSSVFFNRTRRKTRAMAARLKEMLFPSDDSNWDIEPTPVPELAVEAEAAVERSMKAQSDAEQAPQDAQAQVVASEAKDEADAFSALLDSAAKSCDAMRREIEDVLVESRYDVSARMAIDDAAKLGAGVVKGPVQSTVRRRGWARVAADGDVDGGNVYELTGAQPGRPEFRWVDPWSLFPDTNARTPEESEGWFERHLMNAKQLRRLAKDDSFDRDALRRVLKMGPDQAAPSYISSLRNITGDQISSKDIFQVWEYSGPLDAEEVASIARAMSDEDMALEAEDADPLDEMHVVLWFCRNEVLKFGVYPLDSDEPLYSFFALEPDEASLWGKGIPRLMRDNQDAMNAGWRAMLDNGGFALGPHIVINDDMVEPADGNWDFKGPKLWRMKGTIAPGQRAFDQFQSTMNQQQLAGIIGLAERFIDEETGMPQIATGDQTEQTTKTVGGMALLMSQGNLTFREIVRRFDDSFTVPNLRRCYDWLMQFSPKDEIKGDYEVKARGASALLMREVEATNLLMVSSVYGADDPDIRGEKVKRAIFRALGLDPDEFIRTASERDEYASQQSQGPTEADIKAQEMELRRDEMDMKTSIAEMEADSRLQLAEIQRETTLMALAEKMNIEVEKLQAMLNDRRADRVSSEVKLAAEIEDKRATGVGAGGLV